MLIETPPNLMLDANTRWPSPNPGRSLMSSVATLPVTSLVTAMLRPCSIRNVASVTRKLCSLVRISRVPFRNPMASDSSSAAATPSQMLPNALDAKIAAQSEDVVTATPALRSNSPPIISSATATAGMPRIEDW